MSVLKWLGYQFSEPPKALEPLASSVELPGIERFGAIENPPYKWHGGKHYLAKRVRALMPPHTHYVEPYFGGGAVLLAGTGEGVSEVINDIHGGVVNFWRVLQSESLFGQFKRLVEAIPFSLEEFEKAKAICDIAAFDAVSDEGKVKLAAYFFVACRQSRQGLMKDFATLTKRRTRRGMNEQVSSWLTAVEGLPDVHNRMKRVVVLNKPAISVIKSEDTEETFFELDPPYLHETRVTKADYLFEMNNNQHVELLEVLAGISGKFILHGYPSALYAEAAAKYGWDSMEFDLPNNASGKKTKDRKREVVWANFKLVSA